jgi:hypothetical protein
LKQLFRQWHCEGQGFDPPRLHHVPTTWPHQLGRAHNIPAVFAACDINLRRGRMDGVAAVKLRGVYKSGKARIDPAKVRKWLP